MTLKKNVLDCKACLGIKFNVKKVSSSLISIEIFVPQRIVGKLERYAVRIYRNYGSARGFDRGLMPEKYVKDYFKKQIGYDVKKFVLKFIVLDYLQSKNHEKGVIHFQFPRLKGVRSEISGGLTYVFGASIVNNVDTSDWKKLSFLPPRRKLYKDLDRQAKMFIENEVEQKPRCDKNWTVQDGDWVCFSSKALVDDSTDPMKDHYNRFWMKIATKYLIDPLQRVFFNKKAGDDFCIKNFSIHGMPSDTLSKKGEFQIIINSVWRGDYFCLDLFKSAFGLGCARDVHDKLVEVFSFRNDISQRRSIVEEVFRVLLARFRLEIPRHLVLRRQEHILRGVKKLPDYHVYKSSSGFLKQIEELAERQLREEAIIDFISRDESIDLADVDIHKYLNLLSNSRLSEFVYFKPQMEGFGQTVLPIREKAFSTDILREKALNFIIGTIAKKDLKLA